MILRSFMLFCALMITVVCERSFFAFLPDPFSWISPVFIVGLLLIHFVDAWTGSVWLFFGGMLLDLFGPMHISQTVILALAAVLAMFLSRWVFTNRSLYAMMGLGGVVSVGKILMQSVYLIILRQPFAWESMLKSAIVFWISLLIAAFMSYGVIRFLRSHFYLRIP